MHALPPSSSATDVSGLRIHPLSGWREPRNGRRSAARTLRLSGRALAGLASAPWRRELIDRCFCLSTLASLRVQRDDRIDLIFQSEAELAETMEGLAAAMRLALAPTQTLAHDEELLRIFSGRSLEIHRVGPALSFWHIEEVAPNVYACAHPLVNHDEVREIVLDELTSLAGVQDQRASGGKIMVRCLPQKVTQQHLLDVLEPAIGRSLRTVGHSNLERAAANILVNTQVLLSPISDYLAPPLGIVNALLLPLLNVGNARRAVTGFRKGVFSLSALHTSMAFLGFFAFEFFGDALMGWAFKHWPKRAGRLKREKQRQFLARFRRFPRRVWVERDGFEREVGLSDLKPGETIVLRHGDIVPGDGVVHSGSGYVEEGWITGGLDPCTKRKGDTLYASARVTQGELRMELTATWKETVASMLADWYEQAFSRANPKAYVSRFAESSALPSFILLLAGMRRGGIHMGKAAAHADYRTGPALAAELKDLAAMMRCGLAGALIARPAVLSHLAAAECFVIDDSAAEWQFNEQDPRTIGDRLRELGVREVALISHRPSEQIASLAARIGADTHLGRQTALDKAEFVRQRQLFGRKVVYIGDAGLDAAVAEAAEVSVAVAAAHELPNVDVILRHASLEKAVLLRMVGVHSVDSDRTSIRTSLAFNIACAAGALFVSLPILGVVALTNLGTLVNYQRGAMALRDADAA